MRLIGRLFLTRAAPILAALALAPPAFADRPAAPAPAPPPDDATEVGRKAFLRGVELSKREEWGESLAAFEQAATARDAPLVEFNIAYCQRALGRYIAARRTLRTLLRDPTGLAPSQIGDAKAYLTEFDNLIVSLAVTLDPPSAILTVDGRALVPEEGSTDTYLSSTGPGEARPLDKAQLSILLDPGAHVFQAARAGHQDAIVRGSYRPGEKAKLDLRLDVLPATIAIRSEPAAAIVHIDGREVGPAPLEFQRPAGTYRLEVARPGFETYKATLDLHAGQRSDLTAKLNVYSEPLTKKWWFWTGAAVVVAGGVAVTYALTRPSPQPPPYDAGSANWLAHAQGLRW